MKKTILIIIAIVALSSCSSNGGHSVIYHVGTEAYVLVSDDFVYSSLEYTVVEDSMDFRTALNLYSDLKFKQAIH